jgi:hypothetical protein
MKRDAGTEESFSGERSPFLGKARSMGRCGRLSWIYKLMGGRVDLDEIENFYSDIGPVAAFGAGQGSAIFARADIEDQVTERTEELAQKLHIPRRLIEVRSLAAFPRPSVGKICYRTLITEHFPH